MLPTLEHRRIQPHGELVLRAFLVQQIGDVKPMGDEHVAGLPHLPAVQEDRAQAVDAFEDQFGARASWALRGGKLPPIPPLAALQFAQPVDVGANGQLGKFAGLHQVQLDVARDGRGDLRPAGALQVRRRAGPIGALRPVSQPPGAIQRDAAPRNALRPGSKTAEAKAENQDQEHIHSQGFAHGVIVPPWTLPGPLGRVEGQSSPPAITAAVPPRGARGRRVSQCRAGRPPSSRSLRAGACS